MVSSKLWKKRRSESGDRYTKSFRFGYHFRGAAILRIMNS
jgi:hypothetical protein